MTDTLAMFPSKAVRTSRFCDKFSLLAKLVQSIHNTNVTYFNHVILDNFMQVLCESRNCRKEICLNRVNCHFEGKNPEES